MCIQSDYKIFIFHVIFVKFSGYGVVENNVDDKNIRLSLFILLCSENIMEHFQK